MKIQIQIKGNRSVYTVKTGAWDVCNDRTWHSKLMWCFYENQGIGLHVYFKFALQVCLIYQNDRTGHERNVNPLYANTVRQAQATVKTSAGILTNYLTKVWGFLIHEMGEEKTKQWTHQLYRIQITGTLRTKNKPIVMLNKSLWGYSSSVQFSYDSVYNIDSNLLYFYRKIFAKGKFLKFVRRITRILKQILHWFDWTSDSRGTSCVFLHRQRKEKNLMKTQKGTDTPKKLKQHKTHANALCINQCCFGCLLQGLPGKSHPL